MKFRYFVALCATLLLPQATYPIKISEGVAWALGGFTTIYVVLTNNKIKNLAQQQKTRAPQALQEDADENAQSSTDEEKKSPNVLINQEPVDVAPEGLLQEIIETNEVSTQTPQTVATNLLFSPAELAAANKAIMARVNDKSELSKLTESERKKLRWHAQIVRSVGSVAKEFRTAGDIYDTACLVNSELRNLSIPDTGAGVGSGVPQLTFTDASNPSTPRD